eukprot:jgi/Mesvir1/2706/Mv05103-RA.1
MLRVAIQRGVRLSSLRLVSHSLGVTHVATQRFYCNATPRHPADAAFRQPPQSLRCAPAAPQLDAPESASQLGWVRGTLLRALGYFSSESRHIRASVRWYDSITKQSEDPALWEVLRLPPSFRVTYGLLCVHMWVALCRLRAEGEAGRELSQILYDRFMADVELRVHREGVFVRRKKWLKELELNWYGCAIAYDKAVAPGSAPDEFANALWRNIFSDDGSLTPSAEMRPCVDALDRYVRRELTALQLTELWKTSSICKSMWQSYDVVVSCSSLHIHHATEFLIIVAGLTCFRCAATHSCCPCHLPYFTSRQAETEAVMSGNIAFSRDFK